MAHRQALEVTTQFDLTIKSQCPALFGANAFARSSSRSEPSFRANLRYARARFTEAPAGSEGERDDRVVAEVAGGRAEDQALLVGGEGRGGVLRHRH